MVFPNPRYNKRIPTRNNMAHRYGSVYWGKVFFFFDMDT